MSEMKFPVGIQSFEDLRNKGFVYIDKTALVYQLVDTGKYYFLSRPRRFGKSLLMSTIEAYLSGRKDLFEGLALEKLETEWTQYPILHLDLNSQKYDTPEALTEVLDETLTKWETVYGSNDAEIGLGRRFGGVMQRAYEKTGRQVVVLIDEYDKPLLQAYGNDDLLNDYRGTLKAFYGNLKSCDKYIKFALLTGVTKFGKVSVFSDLNNLEDISMLKNYTGICGITNDELHQYFDLQIEELAQDNGMTKEDAYDKLREDYDGYHFCQNSEGIYNPFSVLNT
ncbi:MAG: AAA family ATPase, partial [Muribaculaceae bacterium]|nr:AAA family ATPase [Muribaculaceae bacterium]